MTEHSASFDRIFQQEQIARAAEPRIGMQSVGNIQLIPLDREREPHSENREELFRRMRKVVIYEPKKTE